MFWLSCESSLTSYYFSHSKMKLFAFKMGALLSETSLFFTTCSFSSRKKVSRMTHSLSSHIKTDSCFRQSLQVCADAKSVLTAFADQRTIGSFSLVFKSKLFWAGSNSGLATRFWCLLIRRTAVCFENLCPSHIHGFTHSLILSLAHYITNKATSK